MIAVIIIALLLASNAGAAGEYWNEPTVWMMSLACCALGPNECAGQSAREQFDWDLDCDVDLRDTAEFQKQPALDRRPPFACTQQWCPAP